MRRWLMAVALAALALGLSVNGYAEEMMAEGAPGPAVAEAEAEPAKPSPVAEYFKNRGKDFLDMLNLKLALGDGASVLAHARLTRLAQIGAGRFVGTKIGFQGPSAGVYGEGRVEAGLSIFYWSWIGRKTTDAGITDDALKTNRFFGKVDDIEATQNFREFYDGNRPWYTVGAAFSLPFLPGLEAEFNPAEAIDFVLSWIPIKALRIPPPFKKKVVEGEKVPDPYSIRWHGQEEFEQYD